MPLPRRTLPALFILLLAVLLSGCAQLFVSPASWQTETELRAARGEPSRVWHNDDSSRTLEYATQPEGEHCWMYTVNEAGTVLAAWNALAAQNLARVTPGMSPEQVTRLLGQHRSIQRFVRSGEEVWDWTIANEGIDLIATRFNVHFVAGVVQRTSRTYVYPRESFWDWSGVPGSAHGAFATHGPWPGWGTGPGVWPGLGPRFWPHFWPRF